MTRCSSWTFGFSKSFDLSSLDERSQALWTDSRVMVSPKARVAIYTPDSCRAVKGRPVSCSKVAIKLRNAVSSAVKPGLVSGSMCEESAWSRRRVNR